MDLFDDYMYDVLDELEIDTNFIFVKIKGKNKGQPLEYQDVDALFKRLRQKTGINVHAHLFRHIYAIKLLNGGTDILTVQELLAHASPEMTMRYAKLLDDTKRRAFDKAVSQGVFSFDTDGNLQDETNGKIPKDILDML